MQYEVSCGAVVFTRTAGERRYVIVKSLEGYYGFPKRTHVTEAETRCHNCNFAVLKTAYSRPSEVVVLGIGV